MEVASPVVTDRDAHATPGSRLRGLATWPAGHDPASNQRDNYCLWCADNEPPLDIRAKREGINILFEACQAGCRMIGSDKVDLEWGEEHYLDGFYSVV